MDYFNFFFKLYGLKPLIDAPNINYNNTGDDGHSDTQETIESITIYIDNDEVKTDAIVEKVPFYHNIIIRSLINYTYILAVFCIVAWPCLYSIIKASMDSNYKYVVCNLFSFMYLTQYLCGCYLYSKKFIYRFESVLDSHKIMSLVINLISVSLCCGFTIGAVLLLIYGSNDSIYSQLYRESSNTGRILICIISAIDRFYCYSIFFMNLIMFSAIFMNQNSNIHNFDNKLKSIIKETINDITINVIIEEYTGIKCLHSKAIDKFNNIFTSITILGLLGSYFTMLNFKSDLVGVFTYIDIGLFVIVELIYILIINRIKNCISDIKKIVDSPQFVYRFLNKDSLGSFYGDVYKDYAKDAVVSSGVSGINDICQSQSVFQSQSLFQPPQDINESQYFPDNCQEQLESLLPRQEPETSLESPVMSPVRSPRSSLRSQLPSPLLATELLATELLATELKSPLKSLQPTLKEMGHQHVQFKKIQMFNTPLSNTESTIIASLKDNNNDNDVVIGNDDNGNGIDIDRNISEVIKSSRDLTPRFGSNINAHLKSDYIDNINFTSSVRLNLDDIQRSKSRVGKKPSVMPSVIPFKHQNTNALGNSIKEAKDNVRILKRLIGEIHKNDPNIEKKIDLIKNISYRGVIISHQNAENLDWLILYQKLYEPWDYFSVFGFDFDDVTLIQKLLVIVFGILGILNLNTKLGL